MIYDRIIEIIKEQKTMNSQLVKTLAQIIK